MSEIWKEHWKELKHELLVQIRRATADEAVEKAKEKLEDAERRASRFFSTNLDLQQTVRHLRSIIVKLDACGHCKSKETERCSKCSDYAEWGLKP